MLTFTATTWNVENLFRPDAAATTAIRDRYDRKLELLAATLKRLDPDVIALQEVGGLEPLADLQQRLPAYESMASSIFPDDRGIRVAFLSKRPIVATEHIADFPPGPALQVNGFNSNGMIAPIVRMGRGALRIQVRHMGVHVDLINVHLKSKLLTFPRPNGRSSFVPRNEHERAQVAAIALMRRSAEAVTVRMRANDLLVANAATPLVVLGDFNDVPEAQTSLVMAGPPGSELGTAGFARSDAGDDARLFGIAAALPPGRNFSRVHRGRGELLDQIYASEELFPLDADGRRLGPIRADSNVDFAGELASVSENPEVRSSEIAPDHAPVSATFRLS